MQMNTCGIDKPAKQPNFEQLSFLYCLPNQLIGINIVTKTTNLEVHFFYSIFKLANLAITVIFSIGNFHCMEDFG